MIPNRSNSSPEPVDYPFIFIVGAPRSGTTLLSSMLNSHSKIAIPYESNFMVHCYDKYGLTPDLTNDVELDAIVEEILSGYFVSKWKPAVRKEDLDFDECRDLPGLINEIYRCYARKKGKLIWGDKTPGYTPHIHVLNKVFPHAKYIHIVRDGRDVALSLLQKSWGPSNFPIAIRFWKEMVALCQVQLSMLPSDRYIELRFEDLVKNPEDNLKRICLLLHIDYEKNMANDYSSEFSTIPDSIKMIHRNLQEQPSEKQCFKWKDTLDGPDQAIAYEIAGDLLERQGYDVSVKNHKFKLAKVLYYRIKESIAWRLKRSRSL